MWHCPKCGEQLDDGFDVCWNCGTARDGTADPGFHAESDDPAVPDPGPGTDQPKETAGDQATPLGMAGQRIVEVVLRSQCCWRQIGLSGLLEEAGINARVVGEVLGNAAGGLPLGEATAPRIWVLGNDAARAREIIGRWRDGPGKGPIAWPENDAPPPWETPAEEDEGPLPSDVRFRFLSQGFWIARRAVHRDSALWAWQNWLALRGHPATADGWLTAIHWRDLDKSDKTDAGYAYFVGHKKYFASMANVRNAPLYAPVYYDPSHPAEGVVGPLRTPWIVLTFALAVGVFLSFVGYQFR